MLSINNIFIVLRPGVMDKMATCIMHILMLVEITYANLVLSKNAVICGL